MSAFLGPIHSWLFNKIRFEDELTLAILNYANKNDLCEQELGKVDLRYGKLEEGELVDIVDESNIHGWLQDRISVVENRLAYVVTVLTKINEEQLIKICETAYSFGEKHAINNSVTVKEAFNYLETVLLNGMPCDRVNEILSETENEILWRETTDIHASYWESMGGEPLYYRAIRRSLIDGLLCKSGITFVTTEDHTFALRRNTCTE